MGVIVQVKLPYSSGLPKDVAVNNITIGSVTNSPPTSGELIEIFDSIGSLWTQAVTPPGETLGSKLSSTVSRAAAACEMHAYDISDHLDGSPHGSPIASGTFTLPAADSALSLPAEVAMAVTLEANNRGLQLVEVPDGADPGAAPDRPRQRYTGRFYLGPFTGNANAMSGGIARPTLGVIGVAQDATVRLCDAITGIGGDGHLFVGVWSRKDQRVRAVKTVRVDDAWDTQRSRGNAPVVVYRKDAALAAGVELAA